MTNNRTESGVCPECAAVLQRVLDKVADMTELAGPQWAKVSNFIHAELQGRGTGRQPAQPLDVSWLPMGDAHPIELSKAGCDPITGKPAQPLYDSLGRCINFRDVHPARPGSGEVSRLAFAAGVTLGELHGNESAELQCILRKLIAAQQRIAELERDLENERARGIHTCHDQCERPLCVAGRRIRELEALNAERNRQNAAAFTRVDELRGRILAFRDSLRDESFYTAASLRTELAAVVNDGEAAR